jgi:hypothetical protein
MNLARRARLKPIWALLPHHFEVPFTHPAMESSSSVSKGLAVATKLDWSLMDDLDAHFGTADVNGIHHILLLRRELRNSAVNGVDVSKDLVDLLKRFSCRECESSIPVGCPGKQVSNLLSQDTAMQRQQRRERLSGQKGSSLVSSRAHLVRNGLSSRSTSTQPPPTQLVSTV